MLTKENEMLTKENAEDNGEINTHSIADLIEKIKKCKLGEKLEIQILKEIKLIQGNIDELEKYSIPQEEATLEQFKEVTNNVNCLIQHNQIKSMWKWNPGEQQKIIQSLAQSIEELLENLKSEVESLKTITTSDLRQQHILQNDSIEIEVSFTLSHISLPQFTFSTNLQMQEHRHEVYTIRIMREAFWKKIKNRSQFNKDWENYIDSQIKRKNTLLFAIDHHRMSLNFLRYHTIVVQKKIPFIIKNNYRIYLASGMMLMQDQGKVVYVEECSVLSSAILNRYLTPMVGKLVKNTISEKGSIEVSDLSYIKLHYKTINKSYEFYLNNQEIDLQDYLPEFRATLCHDDDGFYLTTEKGNMNLSNSSIKLFTSQRLKTNSDSPFSLQVSKECILEVKFNKKAISRLFC